MKFYAFQCSMLNSNANFDFFYAKVEIQQFSMIQCRLGGLRKTAFKQY